MKQHIWSVKTVKGDKCECIYWIQKKRKYFKSKASCRVVLCIAGTAIQTKMEKEKSIYLRSKVWMLNIPQLCTNISNICVATRLISYSYSGWSAYFYLLHNNQEFEDTGLEVKKKQQQQEINVVVFFFNVFPAYRHETSERIQSVHYCSFYIIKLTRNPKKDHRIMYT